MLGTTVIKTCLNATDQGGDFIATILLSQERN